MKTIRRQYDEEFKKMAVELADVKGSLKVTAEDLGITPQITDSKHTYPVAENHLNRQFNPVKPGQA